MDLTKTKIKLIRQQKLKIKGIGLFFIWEVNQENYLAYILLVMLAGLKSDTRHGTNLSKNNLFEKKFCKIINPKVSTSRPSFQFFSNLPNKIQWKFEIRTPEYRIHQKKFAAQILNNPSNQAPCLNASVDHFICKYFICVQNSLD